jgi:CheY-like chemotaxis protein
MSGMEVVEKVRAMDIPIYTKPPFIIALTANALDRDRERCMEVGMNGYIAKPFKLDDLKRALEEAVFYHTA